MKKEVLWVIILGILFLIPFIYSQEDKEIANSYDCLKKKLENNCGNTQNTIQTAFNLLAMAYDSKIKNDCKSLLNNLKKNDCWPESAGSSVCTIKSTAISSLALKYINENIDNNINWIKSKKILSKDLIWYLEIDTSNSTECSVNGQSFKIDENKKIYGNDPQGLIKSYSNYWFQINDLTKNYTISCNDSFSTTLIYKKPNSGIYYISGETHSASAFDSTTESANGYCLSTSDNCDYEGTLWAVLLLSKAGEDITPYIPYITAMADESVNSRYLPFAFLFMLDNSDLDYLSKLLSLQKLGKYWDVSGNKFYDTALALLALQGGSYQELINAKNYLISQRISSGENSGCWPSDTSFILYTGWPKSPSFDNRVETRNCEAFNYSCTSRGECSLEDTLTNFECSSLSQVCCRVKPVQLTCEQKGGLVCKDDEECTGNIVTSADERFCCIMGSCQKIQRINECENNNGSCKSQCSSEEEEEELFSNSCSIGEICCISKPKKSSSGWWLIILLIILIILVILAIIFRNKLRIWFFKIKSKFKPKKIPPDSGAQRYPPNYPLQRQQPLPRQIIPRQQMPSRPTRPRVPPSAQKDKEFEEVMKKLKEMSK